MGGDYLLKEGEKIYGELLENPNARIVHLLDQIPKESKPMNINWEEHKKRLLENASCIDRLIESLE